MYSSGYHGILLLYLTKKHNEWHFEQWFANSYDNNEARRKLKNIE